MELPPYYPILDTALLERRGCGVAEAVAALIEGGARIVQFRHKGHFSRAVFAAAEQAAGLCRRHGVVFIVDDRADVAKLLEAGVHLGQEDLPPRAARRILGDSAVIGFSTHNERQLEAAREEPVDYVALGPIFTTQSKERPDPVVGVEKLRAWRKLTGRPLVAIGGITRAEARAVLEAGADSVAVIADAWPEPCTPEQIRRRTQEWVAVTSGR